MQEGLQHMLTLCSASVWLQFAAYVPGMSCTECNNIQSHAHINGTVYRQADDECGGDL